MRRGLTRGVNKRATLVFIPTTVARYTDGILYYYSIHLVTAKPAPRPILITTFRYRKAVLTSRLMASVYILQLAQRQNKIILRTFRAGYIRAVLTPFSSCDRTCVLVISCRYRDYLPPTKEEVNVSARDRLSVCLSVCLLARLLKKRVHGFG